MGGKGKGFTKFSGLCFPFSLTCDIRCLTVLMLQLSEVWPYLLSLHMRKLYRPGWHGGIILKVPNGGVGWGVSVVRFSI